MNKQPIWLPLAFLMLLCSVKPATVLADEQYRVQAGDVLEVSVWKEEDLNRELLVRPDGYFSFPLVGDIQAAGKSIEDIRLEVISKIEKFIPDPEVNIALIANNGNRFYVIGKVASPGAVVMNQATDVMQALSLAGGTTTFAKLNSINILRRENGQQRAIPFRYSDVEKGENLEQNILLERGDIVVVP